MKAVKLLLNVVLGLFVDFEFILSPFQLLLIVFSNLLQPLGSYLTMNDLFVADISFYLF